VRKGGCKERVKEGEYGGNNMYSYENWKMRPAETVPRMVRGRIKENDGGVNSIMIHCKKFCECHNVTPLQ
jgi:hypothetical protein